MRAFWVALGAAGLLIVPQAFADFSFSFSSRPQQEHAGSSSGWGEGASAQDASSHDASSGGSGGGGATGPLSYESGLLSLPNLSTGLHGTNAATSGSIFEHDVDCVDPAAALSASAFIACSNLLGLASGAVNAKVLDSHSSSTTTGSMTPSSGGGFVWTPSTGGGLVWAPYSGGGVTSMPSTGSVFVGTPSSAGSGRSSSDGTGVRPVDGSSYSALPGTHGRDGGDATLPGPYNGPRDPSNGSSATPGTTGTATVGGSDPFLPVSGPGDTLDPLGTAPFSTVAALTIAQPVPEPGSLALVGLAVVVLAILLRGKRH